MTEYVMHIKNIRKAYQGGKEVIKDLTLSFIEGAKIGIVGHNGSGKSTLLKIFAGQEKDYSGELWVRDGYKVGYLAQEPELNPELNVKDNIMLALQDLKNLLDEFNAISAKFAEEMDDDTMNDLLAKQAEIQNEIEARNAWDLERQVEIAMDALRCPEGDADVTKISGGEKRRVALCKLLLEKPEILLLDEPTNHLDAESVAWLENFLKAYKGMVILVTHDRYFLDNITEWILELDRGEGIPYKGNYSGWLEQKYSSLHNEEKQQSAMQKSLAEELSWVQQSAKGRHSKSKARLKAYEELLEHSKSEEVYKSQIVIPSGAKLGNLVIKGNNLYKSFGDKLLIEDFSFNIPRGAVVGIIGANGAGKSTLFKMITEVDTPDKGNIEIGESVKLGYVDQSRDALNANNTVWQEIADGLDEIDLGNKKVASRAYVAGFAFKGGDQQKKIGMLSGGERNRVHLAKMVKSGSNVLLLDEPSNDLDIETLRALEEAILNFAGCVLVISHDRWFLNRIATHIIAFEGDSKQVFFEGNYNEYEEDMKKRLGITDIVPKRIKYKPLTIN
ncbi:energy-dependent translational throttle protein EttA [Rickettsiales bacterium LUAb2]